MFENLFNSNTPDPIPFKTEKELILHVIDKFDTNCHSESEIYHKYASREWRNNSQYFSLEYSRGVSVRSWDSSKLKYLVDYCDDVDILRAVFESGKIKDEFYPRIKSYFITNVNLPDDIIVKLCEKHIWNERVLKGMQRVEYKYITEETKAKIAAAIVEYKERARKKKEDKTKKKLTAFLTTAAATKSILTGNSIDDVVEQTITSDVDDAVLDYMNKLFDKK